MRKIVSIITFLFCLLLPAAASAHTGFLESSPADGEVVTGDLNEIIIEFTGDASPTDDGFAILDSAGKERIPDSQTKEETAWILSFDEAFAEGEVGVRWSVQAPDTHPISGSFSFVYEPEGKPIDRTDTESQQLESQKSKNPDLESFLNQTNSKSPNHEPVQLVGRFLTFLGSLVAIGSVIFARTVLRGSPRDIEASLRLVKIAIAGTLLGVTFETLGQLGSYYPSWEQALNGDNLLISLDSNLGLAAGMKAAGGALLVGLSWPNAKSSKQTSDGLVKIRQKLHAGAGPMPLIKNSEPYNYERDRRWLPGKPKTLLLLFGISLIAASFSLNGHSNSADNLPLSYLADFTHVTSAGVWVGGVVSLVLVLRSRSKRNIELRTAQLAIRFSVIAAVALAATAAAGIALATQIIDSTEDLRTTEWGQAFTLKMILVAILIAIGGYNHKVLVPNLASSSTPLAEGRFSKIITIELLIMAMVIIATVFLVVSTPQ